MFEDESFEGGLCEGLFGEEEPTPMSPLLLVNLAELRKKLIVSTKFGIFLDERKYPWVILITERWNCITLKDLKALRLVSSDFLVVVSPVLERHFLFWLFKGDLDLITIKPQNCVVYSLENIPASTKQLTLAGYYHKPLLASDLPPGLTHLTTIDYFNAPIVDLPPTLSHLILGNEFTKTIGSLPPALTYVSVKRCSPGFFEKLPPSVTHLSFSHAKYKGPITSLPPSLVYLRLDCMDTTAQFPTLPPLPASITHLIFWCFYKDPLILPPSLTKLKLSTYGPVSPLPPLLVEAEFALLLHDLEFHPPLTHLTLYSYKTPLKCPPTLTHLKIMDYSQTLDLPASLTHLEIMRMRRPLALPPNLLYLSLSYQYEHPLILPASLTFLELPLKYTIPTTPMLPPSLHTLKVGKDYLPFLPSPLPDSLTVIVKQF